MFDFNPPKNLPWNNKNPNKVVYKVNLPGYIHQVSNPLFTLHKQINCSIPFQHSCFPEGTKLDKEILILDYPFLIRFDEFVIKGLSTKYHVVALQSFLSRMEVEEPFIKRRYARALATPVLYISVFCDELIDYAPHPQPYDYKKIALHGLRYLKTHLAKTSAKFYFLTGYLNHEHLKAPFFTERVAKHISIETMRSFFPSLTSMLILHLNKFRSSLEQSKNAEQTKGVKVLTKGADTERGACMQISEFLSIPAERRVIGIFKGTQGSQSGKLSLQYSNLNVVLPNSLACNRSLDGDVVGVVLDEPTLCFLKSYNSKNEAREGPNATKVPTNSNEDEVKFENDLLKQSTSLENQAQRDLIRGRVACIIERKDQVLYGSFAETEKTKGSTLFLPHLRNYPPISVHSQNIKKYVGKILAVMVEGWEETHDFPRGHIIEVLGDKESVEAQSNMLLREAGLIDALEPFPFALIEELKKIIPLNPKNPKEMDPAYIQKEMKKGKRRDLRDRLVFSVDPPGCVDIDDALHVKPLGTNSYELGVHIADVSHFVEEGSHLDVLAAQRGSSIYLVEKRVDMLPKILSTNVCSLHERTDRLAFSIVWEIREENESFNIVPMFFGKSIIHSSKAFSYQEAEDVLKECAGNRLNNNRQFKGSLETLKKLAMFLRTKRVKNGAMILHKAELDFDIDRSTGNVKKTELHKSGVANHIIEELMILANVTAACQINNYFPQTGILRKHPAVTPERFKLIQETVSKFGRQNGLEVKLDRLTDLTQMLRLFSAKGLSANRLDSLCSKIVMKLQKASYFCAGEEGFKGHTGLALNLYTHFTSPIRRYADIIVHRMLHRISIGDIKEYNIEQMKAVVDNVNEKYFASKNVGLKSKDLYAQRVLKGWVGKSFEIEITKIWEGGLEAYIPSLAFTYKLFFDEETKAEWSIDLLKEEMFRNSSSLDNKSEEKTQSFSLINQGIDRIAVFNKFLGIMLNKEILVKSGVTKEVVEMQIWKKDK